MKKNLITILVLIYFTTVALIIGCDKKLDVAPIGTLDQNILSNQKGVEGLLIGAYSLLDGSDGTYPATETMGTTLTNWVYGNVAADDSYKGSSSGDIPEFASIQFWQTIPSNPFLNAKWVTMYRGVQRANDVLRTMVLATDINDADKKRLAGEARFLRGVYHLELKKIFNNAPFVDETREFNQNNYNVPNVDASGNYIDIWPQIEADFDFAMQNLPETQPHVGRANKWAAASFLAKCYMFEDKYALAKPLFDQIITSGQTTDGKKYDLNENFFDNFNAATDNSKESVFAYQASVNDGSLTQPNGNNGEVANYPFGVFCCGFSIPSYDLAATFKTDGATGLPLLDTWYAGNNVSAPTNPYIGTLDPRIDLTMGRLGIPYLDWGIDQGSAWSNAPAGNESPFHPLKNVYYKSQQKTLTEASAAYWGASGITAKNVNLIRFADVLLWAAECEVEAGSTDKALEYVNRVRSRASNPTYWVHTYVDNNDPTKGFTNTPASNYKIGLYTAAQFADKEFARKAVRFERRLELGMEGHRFFDLQRWDNGTGYMANTLNTYAQREALIHTMYIGANFTKGKYEIFPIPQAQIDLQNAGGEVKLKQNPNY